MPDMLFDAEAFDSYAELIRRGGTDAYAAFRIFDRHWHLRGADRKKVLRKSALLLLAHDPWFLATSFTSFLQECLSRRDIERVTPRIGVGLPAGAAAYLRAKLWFVLTRGDKTAVQRTLTLLGRVPSQYRRVGWHQMVVGCHERSGDWRAYTRAFPRLFAATEADWRSGPLRDVLHNAASHRDWRTYDRWRREWGKLPPTRHVCECNTQTVATLDGVRAAAAGRWDAVPKHLADAGAVTGCAHLNSFGFRLDLVRLLVRRRRHLAACGTYLDRAAQFRSTKELVALRRSVERAAAATRR